MLAVIIIPLILEQCLTSLMGTIDTMMVSNLGSASLSAVSLVDSINILIIMLFTAMAAGGSIICSQYIGSRDYDDARSAARQVLFVAVISAAAVMVLCLLLRAPILKLIFGNVEEAVMEDSLTYFFWTSLSFPFLAVYNTGASVFRAMGNTRLPLIVSFSSNVLNVAGNWVLIWPFHMGVAGAAIATLISRIFLAVAIMIPLRNRNRDIYIRDYLSIRPDRKLICKVMKIAVPSGVENSMFQFGKLAIQSTVSTLGTVAIAAQSMTNVLENLSGMGGLAVGTAMMTVVGQCIGAEREDEAKYYMKKMTLIGFLVLLVNLALITALAFPATRLGKMEEEAAALCIKLTLIIAIFKPIVWPLSFLPCNGMKAAGDVKYSMIVSCSTMWILRVFLCTVLCRTTDIGPLGVWIAMFADWTARSILYGLRWKSGKWLKHKVI